MTSHTRIALRCTIFLGATVLLAHADRPWAADPDAVFIATGLAAAAGHWIASDDDAVTFLYAAAPIGVPIAAGLLLASLVAGFGPPSPPRSPPVPPHSQPGPPAASSTG